MRLKKTWQVQHRTISEYDIWFIFIADESAGRSNLQNKLAVWGLEYGSLSQTTMMPAMRRCAGEGADGRYPMLGYTGHGRCKLLITPMKDRFG